MERLTEFPPRTCLEHVELADSLKADGEGGHIPYQLQKFLENVKNDCLRFLNHMKVCYLKVITLSFVFFELSSLSSTSYFLNYHNIISCTLFRSPRFERKWRLKFATRRNGTRS